MIIVLSRRMAVAIATDFLDELEADERIGVEAGALNVEQANAEIANLDDADAGDVAEAIWQALPGADEILPEDSFDRLVDLVDARWNEIGAR